MRIARRCWPHWSSGIACCAAALALLCSSCAKKVEPLPLHPASGEIRVGGSPAKGVSITLYPAAENTSRVGALRPHAVSREDGSFTLGSYNRDDGVPAGEWLVTLTWPDERLSPQQMDEILSNGDSLPDRFQGRYATTANPALRVTIVPGENRLPAITLPY